MEIELYSGNDSVTATIAAGRHPLKETGADTLFFASSWSSDGGTDAYISELKRLGDTPLCIGFAGNIGPNRTRDVVKRIAGSGLRVVRWDLPDERGPQDAAWMGRMADAIRLESRLPIRVNTAGGIGDAKALWPLADIGSFDMYRVCTDNCSYCNTLDIFKSTVSAHADIADRLGHPMMVIIQGFGNRDCGQPDWSLADMQAWYQAAKDNARGRLQAIGLYAWLKDAGGRGGHGDRFPMEHPDVADMLKQFCAWVNAPTPPLPPDTVTLKIPAGTRRVILEIE